jgi:hypothetical protein
MKTSSSKEFRFTLPSNKSNQNVLSNFRDEAREQAPSFFMCFCFTHFVPRKKGIKMRLSVILLLSR